MRMISAIKIAWWGLWIVPQVLAMTILALTIFVSYGPKVGLAIVKEVNKGIARGAEICE